MNKADSELLEKLLDANSLQGVLTALEEICGEKATHVATNWQDVDLAKRWDAMANEIAKVRRRARTNAL